MYVSDCCGERWEMWGGWGREVLFYTHPSSHPARTKKSVGFSPCVIGGVFFVFFVVYIILPLSHSHSLCLRPSVSDPPSQTLPRSRFVLQDIHKEPNKEASRPARA